MPRLPLVLIVESDHLLRRALGRGGEHLGAETISTGDFKVVTDVLTRRAVDVVLVDGDRSDCEWIVTLAQSALSRPRVVLMVGKRGPLQNVGLDHLLVKPFSHRDFAIALGSRAM